MNVGLYLTMTGVIRLMVLQDVQALSFEGRHLDKGGTLLRRGLGVKDPHADDSSTTATTDSWQGCTFEDAREAQFCESAGEMVVEHFCKGVNYSKYRDILEDFHPKPLRDKLLSIASGQNHASRKRFIAALKSGTTHDFAFWFAGLFYTSKLAAVAAISAISFGCVGWVFVLIPCSLYHAHRTRNRTNCNPLPLKSILKENSHAVSEESEGGPVVTLDKASTRDCTEGCARNPQDIQQPKKSVRFRFDDNPVQNDRSATAVKKPRICRSPLETNPKDPRPLDLITQPTLFLDHCSRRSIASRQILTRKSPQLFDEERFDAREANNVYFHVYPLQANLTIPPTSFGAMHLPYECHRFKSLFTRFSLKGAPKLLMSYMSLRLASLFVIGIIFSTLTIHTVLRTVYSRRKLEQEIKATKCFATRISHDMLYFAEPSVSVPFIGFERLFRMFDEAKSMMPKFISWVETREHSRILAEAASLAVSALRTTDYLLHRQAFYWNKGSVGSLNHRSLAALVHRQLNPNRTASEHLGDLIDAGRDAPFNQDFLLHGLKSVENLLDQTISFSHEMSALLSQVLENIILKENVYLKFMRSLSPLVYASILEVLGCIPLYFIHYLPGWKGCGRWKREREDRNSQSAQSRLILHNTECHGALLVSHIALITGTALLALSVSFLISSRIGRDSCGYLAEEVILNGALDTILMENQKLNQLGPTCLSQDGSGDLFEAIIMLDELEKFVASTNLSYRKRFAEYISRAKLEDGQKKWVPKYSQDLDVIVNLEKYLRDDVMLPDSMEDSNARMEWLDTNTNLWEMPYSDLIISVEPVSLFPISSLSYEDRLVQCNAKYSGMVCDAITIVHPKLAGSSEINIWGIKHLVEVLENMMPTECATRICLDADSGGTCRRERARLQGKNLIKISPTTIQYISSDLDDATHRLALHITTEGRRAAECFERVDAVSHQKWAQGIRLLATKSMALSRPIRYGRNDVYEFSKIKSEPPGNAFSESCGIYEPCYIFVVNNELHENPISRKINVNYSYVDHDEWEATFQSKLKSMRVELTFAECFYLLKFLGYEYSMLQPLRQLLHNIHDQINCTYIQKMAIEIAYMGCNRALPELEKLGFSFFCLGVVNYLVSAVLYARWWKLRSMKRLERSKVMKVLAPT